MAKLDDVSFHSGAADFPDKAPEANGATHVGLFVTWAIQRELWNIQDTSREAVELVKRRAMSGRDFLLDYCDGMLFSNMLTGRGVVFAEKYYNAYLSDFHHILSKDLPSDYLVEDTWANYDLIAPAIDEKWDKFKQDDALTGRGGSIDDRAG